MHSCHCDGLARYDYVRRRQRARSRIGDRTWLVGFHFSARNGTRTNRSSPPRVSSRNRIALRPLDRVALAPQLTLPSASGLAHQHRYEDTSERNTYRRVCGAAWRGASSTRRGWWGGRSTVDATTGVKYS